MKKTKKPESAASPDSIHPGLAIIHANRLETLRDLVIEWLRAHPLAPLEEEIFLVPSNGMAQWLKLALAETSGLGICASVSLQLPGQFLWSAYRAVLGSVPEPSLFGREALTWRLFRLLPTLLDAPGFEPLQRFLASDPGTRKRHQLAASLADLFDQYQVYRADWLRDWEQGSDHWRDAHDQPHALPSGQVWQPALWRAILRDMPEGMAHTHRAGLHEAFLEALAARHERPAKLSRRVVVFGLSSLPQQMLRALHGLGRFSQVLVCAANPCRHDWADIIDDRELLRAERRRHPHKAGMPSGLAYAALHSHSHPLLAAWGKQGRDYLRLLDEWDDPDHYRQHFAAIDCFEDYGVAGQRSLLEQVQQAILDLEPPPHDPAQRQPIGADDSLAFHIAHSPQREVEILHDQLLARFAASAAAGAPLHPRDILVMVPDIDRYAPHIRAVFGQIAPDDPRYLPYSLADQRQRGQHPLLIALETLLDLPESRCSVSTLLDVLDVPALRARFGLSEADLPTLRRWLDGAGVRWGLHTKQRQGLDLPGEWEQNSWRFGLRRIVLGYAVGRGEAWHAIEPYDEIGGIEAALIGPLARFLECLDALWHSLRDPAPPEIWGERLRRLLDAFFQPIEPGDYALLERLNASLEHWLDYCRTANLAEPLPLAVVREAWLTGIEEATHLNQRFLAGRVTFCTLLPMRAIPFPVICLLGMNEGDYPRSATPMGFDLMAAPGAYRPGDRSRRQDDRYLFLEVLLSARRHLHISWVGRDIQDNSERPPSLLVGQLRDYLAAGWRDAAEDDPSQRLLARLTVEHPLQPFSIRYFLSAHAEGHDPRLFSYAGEWRAAHAVTPEQEPSATLPAFVPQTPLTLQTLERFLRHPVRSFFTTRLKVWLEAEEAVRDDTEPFGLDALQGYGLGQELLDAALNGDAVTAEHRFKATLERQQRRGRLPLAGFMAPAQEGYADPAWQAFQRAAPLLAAWPHVVDSPCEVFVPFPLPDGRQHLLEDWLGGLRQDRKRQRWAQILVRPGNVLTKQGAAKFHNMVAPWVRHLAGCAIDLKLVTYQIGPDHILELPAVSAKQAKVLLNDLAEAWYQGLQAPLPLACKTGFARLSAEDDLDQGQSAARSTYEGGYNFGGELSEDAYLARVFPSFDGLAAAESSQDFSYWTTRLYAPLFNALRCYGAVSS